MCNNKNRDCNCIGEILTVICILQQSATCSDDCCLDSCDRGFLGSSVACPSCNTRPIMLYTCTGNGEPWSMPVSRTVSGCEGPTETSCVFRVEKIDGCCATFRVLAPNPDTTEAAILPYVATNSLFTMDLNCCCAVRCLPDTIVDSI